MAEYIEFLLKVVGVGFVWWVAISVWIVMTLFPVDDKPVSKTQKRVCWIGLGVIVTGLCYLTTHFTN